MKYLFIDESKAKDFLLCVVEIDAKKMPIAKKQVESVRKKGQSTVHFVYERESRKRAILSAYRQIPFSCKSFVVKNLSEVDSRRACIQALVRSLNPTEHYRVFLDRDVNHEDSDRKAFRQSLIARDMLDLVDYIHSEPRQEHLLWIPDAIAWSIAKGGYWKKELSNFEISVQVIS